MKYIRSVPFFIVGLLFFARTVVFAIPIPSVDLDVADEVFINEAFTFTVTLDNIDPADTGYEPFIDLILPTAGTDGTSTGGPVDGISFVSATYLGRTVDFQQVTFPASGCVDHPLLEDTSLQPVQLCDTVDNTLVVLRLPLIALTPDHPPAEVTVTAFVSEFADVDVPLTIRSRGGFARGQDSLDNPCCDPFQVSSLIGDPVTPVILTIGKETNAPEDEIAGGDSNVYEYAITLDIADGQTVTDLDITDFMPDNLQFVQIVSVVNSGGTPIAFTDNAPASVGDDLIITIASTTGTSADDDVVITFEYIAPYRDSSGDTVLDETDPQGFFTSNTSQAEGDWSPADPRDGAVADNAQADGTCIDCPGNNAPYIASIAVQKVYTITTDNNFPGESPQDVLTYTMGYQVADSIGVGTVAIMDTLSDGQTFVTDSAVLTYNRLGATVTVNPIVPSITSNADGSTILTFDVSTALLNAGHIDAGDVLGGCIPTGGAGASSLDCGATDATGGTLTYQATIDDAYTNTSGGTINVDHGDLLSNEAEIEGIMLAPSDLTPSATVTLSNDTQVEFNIVNAAPTKSIYALNGVPCGAVDCAGEHIFPLDEITYRIQQTVPTSDFENLQLADFLPQAVFDAREVTTFDDTGGASATTPAAGTAKYGANDTTVGIIAEPTIITEPTVINNTVIFDYGANADDTNTLLEIDILFTVTVLSAPYPRDQVIGNVIQTQEDTTNDGLNTSEALAAMPLETPIIVTTKGAVASTGTDVTFVPPQVGPVTFNPPGSSPAFTGLINSNGLETSPIGSDITGVQVGDIVTFAIVVESIGNSEFGVFDIVLTDDIPPGFGIPAGGSNVQVALGDGTTIAYTNLGDGVEDLFDDGIELVDFDAMTGVCTPYNATSGANIAVITYDLELMSLLNGTVTNTGFVNNFSARNLGGNYLALAAQSGTADIIVAGREDDDDEDDDTAVTDAIGVNQSGTNSSDASGANLQATQEALLSQVQTLPATGQSPMSHMRSTLIVLVLIAIGGGAVGVLVLGIQREEKP